MNPISIHSIDNRFSDEVVELILNIQQNEFGLSLTIDDQPDLLNIESYYTRSGGGFWGAFYNGKLVGTIALIKFSESKGAIRKMFVASEFRGQTFGIAQLLLSELLSYCKENKINSLYLGTQAVLQAAGRFYEKNRFSLIDKAELPQGFPLMEVDNRFYSLKLE